ncbi:hypothetical protein HDG32_007272 [Paraburkholderia sp. CI2]|uniref:hypothetical protein n=1 Tax=Paraburkholderia sp. CI2 TaxID=2723093 RepID=UPI0016185B9C|nr:hypothetical protein [Paraburkholderia sp. CI2]MBB5471116.1 hypothetical protein [Paraburkholderia sp. CI2]
MEVTITISDGATGKPSLPQAEGVSRTQTPQKGPDTTMQGVVPDDIASKAAALGALNAGPAPSSFPTIAESGAPLPFVAGSISELALGGGLGQPVTESAGGAPNSDRSMETHTIVVSDNADRP